MLIRNHKEMIESTQLQTSKATKTLFLTHSHSHATREGVLTATKCHSTQDPLGKSSTCKKSSGQSGDMAKPLETWRGKGEEQHYKEG